MSPRSGASTALVNAGLDEWIEDIGGPLTACRYIETATRHLADLEHAFSRAASFECRVDTIWSDGTDELATIGHALSRTLQHGTGLEIVRIAFGEHCWDQHSLRHLCYDDSSRPTAPRRGSIMEWARASNKLCRGLDPS
ncbi:hypothetical protein B0A55_10259 [Friedmanniomyces simplex]|uniref:Uncharacterized protein n=1 Tax=Friedmanniomyces simplex TaxID=329884 RepID=A0A4U0WYQ5_9PEZI|nr:hypothetical protein B0A55_10259 [Friedmanniomyces simplex]